MAENWLTCWKLSDFDGLISGDSKSAETVGRSLVGSRAELSDTASQVSFKVSDDDNLLQDAYKETGEYSTLAQDLVIDGITFAADSTYIEAEYRLYTDDDPAIEFTVIAIGDSSSNTTSSGTKLNYLVYADQPLDPGATYTFAKHSDGPSLGYEGPPDTICFAAGTMIDTPHGPVAVEALQPGDKVLTRDSGALPILWTGQRHFTGKHLHLAPHLAPIRIRAGALGPGSPANDLLVSPQHRVAIENWRCETLFGEASVLAPAKALCDDCNVTIEGSADGVTYCHLLLESHELVRANGHWAETLLTGPQAQEALGTSQILEIEEIFPELITQAQIPACPILTVYEAQLLMN
ncbi:Hint domain-containing protein [Aliiruegeria haliotis]|uniref:Hint domain-containing protein n=1 Tax=Aliiruegeria haliotis TaxID=1280846 RepID=A0A2T0RUU8_9RHOB|nr:Hint domain-containing protein [Aliiruegeria haliotis]PRY24930.1 Hint domain-containing protein [Aliiruegeria haliotis]